MTWEQKQAIYRRADSVQWTYIARFGYSYRNDTITDAVREMRRIMPKLGSNPDNVSADRMTRLLRQIEVCERLLKED